MVTVVIYDIPDDRSRGRVANECKNLGLVRIQYSAFAGFLSPLRREELERRVRRIMGQRPGSVRLFPICHSDLARASNIQLGGYTPW